MLTPGDLAARCVELGILDENATPKWNGMCLETDDAWYSQPSPKEFPDRIARATLENGVEVIDVFDSNGFLSRLGESS